MRFEPTIRRDLMLWVVVLLVTGGCTGTTDPGADEDDRWTGHGGVGADWIPPPGIQHTLQPRGGVQPDLTWQEQILRGQHVVTVGPGSGEPALCVLIGQASEPAGQRLLFRITDAHLARELLHRIGKSYWPDGVDFGGLPAAERVLTPACRKQLTAIDRWFVDRGVDLVFHEDGTPGVPAYLGSQRLHYGLLLEHPDPTLCVFLLPGDPGFPG